MTARRGRSPGAARPTHLDERGRLRMVDVGSKQPTLREAVAEGRIGMSRPAFAALRRAALRKGDALTAARLAGIAAAKRTADLIPLCHAIPLDHVEVELRLEPRTRSVLALATARARWTTGVEMEAMVAVAAALLTLYDMAKAIDRAMTLGPIRLLRKSGGRSGAFRRSSRR
jgi:cyclic pyranopterin monophosphate synthase